MRLYINWPSGPCQIIILQFLALSHLISASLAGKSSPYSNSNESSKSRGRLAPCQACRILVTSFYMGVERTKKGYESNELRFVQIQEGLCGEVSQGKEQCLELASENERNLEDWWNTNWVQGQGEELSDWLCIDKLLVCCPENHYGPECLPCSGYPSDICSGHGKCKGNGTRKGSGECSCDTGYSGEGCNKCAKNYYEAYKDKEKLLCSACHKACQGGCSGAGAKNCAACKDGWETDDEQGCIDLNECLLEMEPCKQNEFCVNAEGSYKCIECDKSCDGCYGDGPDMCEKCADGFFLHDKICIDGSNAERNFQISTTRYLTYFGLCVATCIIFQKNIMVASIIGLVVAVYITVSEYLLSKSQFQ